MTHRFEKYWEGLVDTSGHVTFRITDRSTERHVYTISPLAVGNDDIYVAVRTFKIAHKGYRVNGSDKFVGEYTVRLGSYVDVVNAVAQKEGHGESDIQYV